MAKWFIVKFQNNLPHISTEVVVGGVFSITQPLIQGKFSFYFSIDTQTHTRFISFIMLIMSVRGSYLFPRRKPSEIHNRWVIDSMYIRWRRLRQRFYDFLPSSIYYYYYYWSLRHTPYKSIIYLEHRMNRKKNTFTTVFF